MRIFVAGVILAGSIFGGCDKETATKDVLPENTDEISTSSLAIFVTEQNPLAQSTPFELQVISPTQSTGEALSVNSLNLPTTLTSTPSDSYLATMQARLNKLIADDPSECVLNLDFTPKTTPDCANKNVSETATAKSVESEFIVFPDNIMEGRLGSEPSDPMAKRVLDDAAGIIVADEDGQSCSKAMAEYFVDRTASSINMAQDIVASLLCIGNNSDSIEGLPAPDASLDLMSVANDAWGSATLDIKKAEISNVGSTTAPKYRMIFSAIRTNAQHDQTKIVIDTLNIPDTENSENYRGRFLVYDQRRVDGVTTPTIISTVYAKNDDNIRIKVRETGMSFDEEVAGLMDDDSGLVDYAKVLALDNNNAMGPSQALYDLNTTDGTGSVAYNSSPSLHSDEVASAFVISVSKDADTGVLSGCGLHGHTTSLVDENNQTAETATIKGKHCLKNQSIVAGPSYGSDLSTQQFSDLFAYVQQQCFSLNTDNEWVIDSTHATWAVAEKCGMDDAAFADQVDLVALAVGLESVSFPEAPVTTGIDFVTSGLDYGIELKSQMMGNFR